MRREAAYDAQGRGFGIPILYQITLSKWREWGAPELTMGRVVIGAVLILLTLAALLPPLYGLISSREPVPVSGETALGIAAVVVIVLVPASILVHVGSRSRAQPIFLVPGIMFAMVHWVLVQPMFAGAETWSTPDLLLMNLFVGLLALGFLAAGVHPIARRLGISDNTYGKLAVATFLIVMIGLTTIEIVVNNRYRDSYVPQLRSGDAATRIAAARELARTGHSRAVPALAEALGDPEPEVRVFAARALGVSESRSAAGPLAAALDDPDRRVRVAAIEALEKLWDTRKETSFVPSLIETLARERATWITSRNRFEALSARERAGQLLNESERRTLYVLSEEIDEANARSVGADIARLLNRIDDDRAAPVLLQALQDEDLAIIAAAYSFFIRRGEAGSERVLVSALDAYGTKDMGEAFLNCGNPFLRDGATQWAKRKGYEIETKRAAGSVTWGSSR